MSYVKADVSFVKIPLLVSLGVIILSMACNKHSRENQSDSLSRVIGQSQSSSIFKMKGFYIGMPMDEAKTNMESLHLGSKPFDQHTLICPVDPFFRLTFDTNDRLTSLQANEGHIIDSLFNVADLSVAEFAQEFTDGYHLSGMTALDPSAGKIGWIYNDQDRGFQVIIYEVNNSKRLWFQSCQTPNFN